MEIELERKLILLESSVREMDERLAELYRDTAGLTIQKSAILQDFGKNVSASKKHAEEAKRMRSELKSDLVNVSEKLAKMDTVILQLNSMRKSARTEKVKEVADLASSVLAVNRRVSELVHTVDALKPGMSDPRIDAFYSELQSIKSDMKKGGDVPQLGPVISRLDAMEGELRSKVAAGELEREIADIKSVVAKLGEKAVLPSDVEALRREFVKSLDDLDMKLKCSFDEKLADKVDEHREDLKSTISQNAGKISELSQSHVNLSKSISDIEGRLKILQKSISAASGKDIKFPEIDLSRVDGMEKRVDEVRARANSILKEIYDAMDALKAADADVKNKMNDLERKMETAPRVSADGKTDVSGILIAIDELRDNISTLSKGIDISKVIAEELKRTQESLSTVEAWKTRSEDMPRELERLAERIAALETVKATGTAKDDVDIKNLKLAIAELSNKNRLINELALENQKLQNRIFIMEEKLGASVKKLSEKDN